MKKSPGCFQRILTLLMILGLAAAAILCYLGYQKAEEAEAKTTIVANLHTVYAADSTTEIDSAQLEEIFNDIIGDNEMLEKIRTGFGDSAVAEMITKSFYLPDNGELSTAIGQRILIHRLKQTYTEQELLEIYWGINGYKTPNSEELQTSEETTKDLLAKATPYLSDVLNYLAEKNIISPEKAGEILEQIQTNL